MSNIGYRYPESGWVLDGVDLRIEKGEYVAVFGANGSGKSTIGYMLNGLIPHFFGGCLKGSVNVCGTVTRKSSVGELFRHVGLVMQDADAQLFNSTVENELAFGLESLGLPAGDIEKKVRATARQLHMEHLLARRPDRLSGGEKRLVAIAAVLCVDPPILLLDEPFANLDWKAARRLQTLLRNIHRSGRTIILIEQNWGDHMRDCTRCLITGHGRLLFDGSRAEALVALKNMHLVPGYAARKRQKRIKADDVVLSVEGLSFDSSGHRILDNVNLDFVRGQAAAIVGANGSGKTTLIKHFNGLLRPTLGKVTVKDDTFSARSRAHPARRVGICFQNPNDQFFKMTVKEEVLAGPEKLNLKNTFWIDRVCRELNIAPLYNRSPYRLSEGEKKRVAIASVLVMQPLILILDEPTVGQDGRFKSALADLVPFVEDMGITVIIVTHDLPFAEATTDRWIALHEGRVAADGTPEVVRGALRLIDTVIPDTVGDDKPTFLSGPGLNETA